MIQDKLAPLDSGIREAVSALGVGGVGGAGGVVGIGRVGCARTSINNIQSIDLDCVCRHVGERPHSTWGARNAFLSISYGQEPVRHRLAVFLPRPDDSMSILEVIAWFEEYQIIRRALESCRS